MFFTLCNKIRRLDFHGKNEWGLKHNNRYVVHWNHWVWRYKYPEKLGMSSEVCLKCKWSLRRLSKNNCKYDTA